MIKLTRPVESGIISQLFGENPDVYAQFGYAGHNGIDYAVPLRTPVLAAADGQVTKIAFEMGGYGNYVIVTHDEFRTYYAHLSQYVARLGEEVKAGTIIGYSGNTGFSTGPHLHFALQIPGQTNPGYKEYFDPLPYMTSEVPSGDEVIVISSENAPTHWVTAGGLRIRSAPSISSNILAHLQKGAQVRVEAMDGDWAQIQSWVHSSFLEKMQK